MGKKCRDKKHAVKVADSKRKSCQEEEGGGGGGAGVGAARAVKTSERKLLRTKLQTEGRVQREDPGDRGSERATGREG